MDLNGTGIHPDPSWPPWLIALAMLLPIASNLLSNWMAHHTIQKSMDRTTGLQQSIANGVARQQAAQADALATNGETKH